MTADNTSYKDVLKVGVGEEIFPISIFVLVGIDIYINRL